MVSGTCCGACVLLFFTVVIMHTAPALSLEYHRPAGYREALVLNRYDKAFTFGTRAPTHLDVEEGKLPGLLRCS